MSNFECTYCGADLVYEDTYGQGAYWVKDNKPSGAIYRCPNSGGFSEEAEAINYLKQEGQYDSFFKAHFTWEEVLCESNVLSVSGSFYTDVNGDLQEGYPC